VETVVPLSMEVCEVSPSPSTMGVVLASPCLGWSPSSVTAALRGLCLEGRGIGAGPQMSQEEDLKRTESARS
jgi:hypothetical protein